MSKKSNKTLNEVFDKYMDNRGSQLISPANFQVYLRGKGWKRKDYLGLSNWIEIKEELNMLYEDWLVRAAAGGERYSQVYTQLLKAHTDKMEREDKRKEQEVSVEDRPVLELSLDNIDQDNAMNFVVDDTDDGDEDE